MVTHRRSEPRTSSPAPSSDQNQRTLGVWGLTGLGIGGIIGAGFFLGVGIIIRQVGPAVLVTYLIAGVLLAQVTGAITSLSVNVPVQTSYQEYIYRFLGSYTGFLLGWGVIISGVLAIGSEAVAMATYSRTWFPSIPLGIYAVGYVLLIVGVNLFGMADFGKIETAMSSLKSAVLLAFIVAAALLVLHWIPHSQPTGTRVMLQNHGFFPNGMTAVFRGMLIAVFSYAGITTLAMATTRTKNPRIEIPRAASWTVLGVIALYVGSIMGLLLLTSWTRLSTRESPFVQVLLHFHLNAFSNVFNAAILIASFSVMAGTFYATEWMLITMADEGEAPRWLRWHTGDRPLPSLITIAAAVMLTLVLAFILPRTVYTDLTSASSYFTFVNWTVILLAFAIWFGRAQKERPAISYLAFFPPYGAWGMSVAVVGLGVYSATIPAFQMGFWVFAATMAVVSIVYALVIRHRSKSGHGPGA